MCSATTRELPELDIGQRLPNVLGLELAHHLERMIIRLEYRPGQHLTEQQICSRFDVSRSPVREAFRQLESIGLVVRQTRKGVRVTPMTHEDVDEVYFVRTPLESMAAGCAAKNASSSDIDYLEGVIRELEDALERDDAEAVFAANVAYFDRVHSMTGNTTLENILRKIEKQARRYRYFANKFSRTMQGISATHLRSILDSIRRGESEEAYRRTDVMMREAHKLIVDILVKKAALVTV